MSTADDLPYRDNAELMQALQGVGESMIERALLLRRLDDGDGATRDPAGTPDRLETLYLRANRQQSAPQLLARQIAEFDADIERQWQRHAARSAASVNARIFVPWVHLALLFRLDTRDEALLLAALLPELDSRYEAILQTLADEHAQSAASEPNREIYTALPGVALLMGDDTASRIELQQRLMSDAVLRGWDLIELAPGTRLGTLMGGYRLSAPIAAYLLARAAPQLRLDEPLEELRADAPLDALLVADSVKAQLTRFMAHASADAEPGSYVLHLQGPDIAQLQRLAASVFEPAGMRCVRLDGRALWQFHTENRRSRATLFSRVRQLGRDALLCNRVLVLSHGQWLSGTNEGTEDLLDDICKLLLDSQRYFVVLNGPARRIADIAHAYAGHRAIPVLIRTSAPDTPMRRRIWEQRLSAFAFDPDETVLTQLVNQYPFTESQIVRALKDAASRALVNPEDESADELLFEACREETRRDQLNVAQEVKTPYRFEDIVLPDATRRALAEVLDHARNRHRVVDNWGFDRKHPNSRNLCVLFHGPSGTGKTMAASIVANALNLSLYRIDLASVVSKYIGETEKQLAQLFDQAEAMNVVLFFDEAESLFAKRTDMKDAHDRYANLQTGYLLQRIETYPGIVILSTNLLQNIDKAFVRRFKFMIEYPFPNAEQRLRLWRGAFPAATPLADDLDFPLLAEKAPLSGGNINNIAIGAAFLAAAQEVPVAQCHVMAATEREYDKLGKVFDSSEFTWGGDE